MKIAILVPGQPRFTEDIYDLFSNLNGYNQADWFVYITNNNIILDETKQTWSSFELDWAYNKISSILPINNSIKYIEISDCEKQSFPIGVPPEQINMCPMLYNLYKANQAREDYEQKNQFKYDLVIRTRPDLGLESEINLKNLEIIPNTIIMPQNEWHGWPASNGLFAIGTSESMSVYSNMYLHLEEYHRRGVIYHAESMISYALQIKQINYIKGNFSIKFRKRPLIN